MSLDVSEEGDVCVRYRHITLPCITVRRDMPHTEIARMTVDRFFLFPTTDVRVFFFPDMFGATIPFIGLVSVRRRESVFEGKEGEFDLCFIS